LKTRPILAPARLRLPLQQAVRFGRPAIKSRYGWAITDQGTQIRGLLYLAME